MSQINNISQTTPIQRIVANPVQKSVSDGAAPAPAGQGDRLELSAATQTLAAQMLAALKTNDVRTDKVADIRQQIQNGTYDADGSKLDAAADKVLDELNNG